MDTGSIPSSCAQARSLPRLHSSFDLKSSNETSKTASQKELPDTTATHEPDWWTRLRSALCGSVVREELRGDFASAFKVIEPVLEQQVSCPFAYTDAHFARGILLLLSGNPQAAASELRNAISLAVDQRDHARQLRCQVWLYQSLIESQEASLDGFNRTADAILRVTFGFDDDFASVLRSRKAKIDELRSCTTDDVALEECALLTTYFSLVALAKHYAFSLCPANVNVPTPARSYMVKAIQRIEITRFPPQVARGSGFANRQRARLFSMCGQDESFITNVTNFREVQDDHERGLARLLESDLILSPVGATVEYWGSLAGLGGWCSTNAETHEGEFYRPPIDKIQSASNLVTFAQELFEAVGSPRGIAHAYLRKSYCAVLSNNWDAGKLFAESAVETFRTVQDTYGENVARLHLVLASIGGSPFVDVSNLAYPIGEWGAGPGSFSVAVSFGRLLLRIASAFWIKRNGQFSEALNCCRAACSIFRGLQSPMGIAEAMLCEGRVFNICGARDDEIICLENSLIVFKNMGNVSPTVRIARRDAVADLTIALIQAHISSEMDYVGLERVLDHVGVCLGLKTTSTSSQHVQELLRKFQDFYQEESRAVSITAMNSLLSFMAVHYLLMSTQILVPAMKASRLQFKPDAKSEFQFFRALAIQNVKKFARNPREKAFYLAIVYKLLLNPGEHKEAALQYYATLFKHSTNSVLDDATLSLTESASINPDGSKQMRRKDLSNVSGYQDLELTAAFSMLVDAGLWAQARECLDCYSKLCDTKDWWRLEQNNLQVGERIAKLLSKEGKFEKALMVFDELISCSEKLLCTVPHVEMRASYAHRSGSISILFAAAHAAFEYLSVAEQEESFQGGIAEKLFGYLEAVKARNILDLKTSNALLLEAAGSEVAITARPLNLNTTTTIPRESSKQSEAATLVELELQSSVVMEWQRLTRHRAILAHTMARLLVESRGKRESFHIAQRVVSNKKRLNDTREALRACHKELNEITERLYHANPALANSARVRGETLPFVAVQDSLPSDTLLLQYFVSRDEVFILIVERNSGLIERQIFEIPERKLNVLIERFRTTCLIEPTASSTSSTQLHIDSFNEAQELTSALLGPIDRCLRDHIDKGQLNTPVRLIISPHRRLHELPFHALPWIESKPLAYFFTISYLYSASELQFLPRGSICDPMELSGGTSILVGDPDSMSHTHPLSRKTTKKADLPDTIEEVNSVASLLRELQENCIVLIGEQATWNNIHTLLNKPNNQRHQRSIVLHFATHFVYVDEAPLWSAVLLANGENLTALQLSTQVTAVDLLVLSACESAHGESTPAGDFRGMVEALRAAGVQRVVASLWPVRDRVARDTMVGFYRGLLGGLEPAEALRGAQLVVRERYGAPCFWAPFVLVG